MSLDIGKISDLYKASVIDKDSREKIEKTGRVNMADYFFEETKIKSVENTADVYDRGGESKTILEENLVLNEEMLNKLGEVVNEDNFSEYEKLGIIPDKDDPTSILTVSERIEIQLATHCDGYKVSGSISIKDLESMYGTSGRAYQVASRLNSKDIYPEEELVDSISKALDKIDSIGNINREAQEYLLTNNKPVTIENVYKATYSVSANQTNYAPLSDKDWSKLEGQVKNSIENMGFEVTPDVMADAKWLVESKIPLNSENIYKLSQIRDINEQLNNPAINTDAWIDKLAKDTVFLGSAESSSMNFYKTVEGDSIEAMTIINNGTSAQIGELLSDGKEVTLLNLKRLQENRSKDNQEIRNKKLESDTTNNRDYLKEINANENKQQKYISTKRALEEARLKMSVEAGIMLAKAGMELNVASLMEVVDNLKAMEDKVAKNVFESIAYTATKEELSIYSDSKIYLQEFANTNAYVLGNVYKSEIEFTVTDIVKEGKVNESALKTAYEAYDLLGTKPDKSLGDSIKKAFKGIDDILKDLGLEDSEENNRAVRILAYNSLEINAVSISDIKDMDKQVTRLIENMTPKMTAYLIANGINPLNTNIADLNEKLEELKSEIEEDEVERYSEYLWKLEKNKEISDEDREAYIGIYRLLNMIEKGDRRAIGAIEKQGSELTLSNLLTASRSLKKTGKEFVIDDSMGLTKELTLGDNNITTQLEKFLNDSQNHNESDEYHKELLAIKSREIENLRYVSEQTLKCLLEDGAVKNMDNILSISYIMNNTKSVFTKIKKVCDDEDVNSDIDNIKASFVSEAADGEEITDEAIEKLQKNIEKLNSDVKEALLNKSEINIEDVRMVNGAVKYMAKAINEQSYYVPVEIKGEETLVKFTLKQSENNRGLVGIRIYSEEQVDLKLKVSENKVKIVEMYNIDTETADKIINVLNEYVFGKETNVDNENVISNTVLFRIAKKAINEINNLY